MRWPDNDVATARRMKADGASLAEIGAAVGKSRSTVSYFFTKHPGDWRERQNERRRRDSLTKNIVPDAVWGAAIGRAVERTLMTPGQIIMNDPPPSQSALAKRI